MERTLASQDKSPPKKKKSPLKSSSSESPESFEATAAGMCNVALFVCRGEFKHSFPTRGTHIPWGTWAV